MKQERVTTKDTIAESFDQLILAVGQQKRFFATAEEIAPFLDTHAAILINIAKRDPDYLGFPICFLGDYLRIPIIPFLKWATGAGFRHLADMMTSVNESNNLESLVDGTKEVRSQQSKVISPPLKIEDDINSKLITISISKGDYWRLMKIVEKTEKNPIELVSRAVRMWIRSKYRVMSPPTCSDIQL